MEHRYKLLLMHIRKRLLPVGQTGKDEIPCISVEWSTVYDQVRICRVCSHFADSLGPTIRKRGDSFELILRVARSTPIPKLGKSTCFVADCSLLPLPINC